MTTNMTLEKLWKENEELREDMSKTESKDV